MQIKFLATLAGQTRDDEDEVVIRFKAPASEFTKVMGIPTRTLLVVTVSTENRCANPMMDVSDSEQPQQEESNDGDTLSSEVR